MEIISFILFSIFIWTTGFYIHELFHLWATHIWGNGGVIKLWWHNGLPSLRCIANPGITSKFMFYLMGGLGAGLLLLFLSIFFMWYPPLFIPLFVVGSINFVYSFYEVLFLGKLSVKDYMKWHYILYLIVGIIAIIISLMII
jgi:hypothetical protein